MEEFPTIVKNKLGLVLTSQELTKLFLKYYVPSTDTVDYDKLTADLKRNIVANDSIIKNVESSSSNSACNINQIIEKIRLRIFDKLSKWREETRLKNAYRLLSQSRSAVVDRAELRNACQYRLSLNLSEKEFDEIFRTFDPYGTGAIYVKNLISVIMRNEPAKTNNIASIDIGYDNQKVKVNNYNADENQNARLTYDKQYKGLIAPEPSTCIKISIEELEDIIRDKISERSSLSSNTIQTLTKLFGDGHSTDGYHYISKDQMKYTIWKRLKLNVAEKDLDKFFAKYDTEHSGQILMFKFIDGIIRTNSRNEPLLEDRFTGTNKTMALKFKKNAFLEKLFFKIRSKINDLINRESRAPHYLFHSVSKMTKVQAFDFFLNRLGLDLKASFPGIDFTNELDEDYKHNGLIDVQRILVDAMSISEPSTPGNAKVSTSAGGATSIDFGNTNNLSLRNGAVVDVNKMPASLQQCKFSPNEIEKIIYEKCLERMKHNHPLSSLHKILRETESDSDPRVITRPGLKNVLRKFDIIMNESDFNDFYAAHDRGDGKINIRQFLDHLVPKNNYDLNPLLPKDEEGFKAENNVAKALEKITGRRRDVSVMNGPNNTRLTGELVSNVLQAQPYASQPAPGVVQSTVKDSNHQQNANPISLTVQTIPLPPQQRNTAARPSSGRSIRYSPQANAPTDAVAQQLTLTKVDSDSDRPQPESSPGPEVHEATDNNSPTKQSDAAAYKAGLASAIKAAIELKKRLSASPVAPSQPSQQFLKPTFQRPFSSTYYVNPAVNDATIKPSVNNKNVTMNDDSNKNDINASWDRSVRPSTAPSRNIYMKINNFKKIVRTKQRPEAKKNDKQKSDTPPPSGNKITRKDNDDDLFSNSNFHTHTPANHPPTPKTIEELINSQQAANANNNVNHNNTSNTNINNHNNASNNNSGNINTNNNANDNTTTNNNNNNNHNEHSSPKSPQRSTPFLSYKTAFTPRSPDNIRSSNFSPRTPTSTYNGTSPFIYTSTTTNTTQSKSKSTSQMTMRPAKSKYVYTGQPRIAAQDPISVAMKLRYAIDKKHTSTSHEDYGMFVKSMKKVEQSRLQLMNKQKKIT